MTSRRGIDVREKTVWIIIASAWCVMFTGCTGTPRSPYAPLTEGERQSGKAEQLTHQAAKIILTDPAKAEKLLREALAADLYHGPAHNNLGVIYLKQGKLFESAGEFEWARKLMPGSPDPRMNLALVLEKAGRVDDALSTYQTALELQPEHLPTIEAMTRLQIRHQRTDAHTKERLEVIAMRGDERWRAWARTAITSR